MSESNKELAGLKLDLVNILYDYELKKLPDYVDFGPLGYEMAAVRAYHTCPKFQMCVEAIYSVTMNAIENFPNPQNHPSPHREE